MWIPLYYHVKPLIPRRVQLAVRRTAVLRKRARVPHLWPIDESAGNPPENWRGWPDGRRFALVLTHDVDTEKGQEKCYELAKLEMRLGFRSSFNFVPRRYAVSPQLRKYLAWNGFEVGVHGLYHDGNYFRSRETFSRRAILINQYLKEWGAVGFRAPCMYHNLDWIHDLDIEYDASTFDTDPFEPQPDGVRTIFPFRVNGNPTRSGYVEIPYTLPQDFTLFVLMKEKNIEIWKRKLEWVAGKGGMVLLITHPDYMNFGGQAVPYDEYPVRHYRDLLEYVRRRFEGQYWNANPCEIARHVTGPGENTGSPCIGT
jgi:hypothetical protein